MKKDIATKQKRELKIEFRNSNLASNTRNRYKKIVMSYYKFLIDNSLDEGIDSVKEWLKTKNNPATYNLTLQAIKEFLIKRFEKEPPERRIELKETLDAIKRKKSNKAKTEFEYLTIKQVEELTKTLTETLSIIIWSLFWSGCRISELINIKLSDCIVRNVVSARVVGKGNKERTVYLPKDLFNRIRNIFQGKEYLFETRAGKKYTRTFIGHELRRQSLKKMNMRIYAHLMRHSKAMYLKQDRGLSADQVAKALGHSSVITTLQYYYHGIPTPEEQGIK